jgi:hypothetical protein
MASKVLWLGRHVIWMARDVEQDHYVRALKHYQENDFAECLSDLKIFSESNSVGEFGEIEKVYQRDI